MPYYYVVKATYETSRVLGPASNTASAVFKSQTQPQNSTVIPAEGNYNWNGTWDTSWKDLKLTQSENQVTGTFDKKGSISGTVQGS